MSEEIIELDQSVESVSPDVAGLNMGIVLCNQLHAEIKFHKEAYQSKVAYLGWQLVRAKESLPHGEFSKLFKSNKKNDTRVAFELQLDFTIKTGQRYMSYFRERLKELERRKLAADFTKLLENADADMSPLCAFMGEQYPDFVSIRDEQYKATNPFEGVGKDKDKETPSAEDLLAARKAAVTEAVNALADRVQVMLEDGSFTLADAATRGKAAAIFKQVAAQLAATLNQK